MTIKRILAQLTVSDLDRATDYYGRVFGREPDARPMDGLLEWHLADTFGVQVWLDPENAGHAAMVFDESDLEARATQLSDAGVEHEGIQAATSVRILPVTDPDGNRMVFTGPLED